MNVTVSDPKSTQKQLEIEIPQENIKESFDAKIKKYGKEISIKGFRKGKVPKNVVVARFGPSIRQEAVEETIDAIIKEEFKKNNIEPVAPANLQNFEDDEKGPIKLTVIVDIDPEIEITKYEKLGVKVGAVKVSDKDVKEDLERMLKSIAEEKTITRKAKKGDVVIGDYLEVKIGEEPSTIPEKPEFRIEIGSSQTKEFDAALKGVKAGEEIEVSFTYPKDFFQEDLREKAAYFKLNVTEVKELTVPELDDEAAKKFGAESSDALTTQTKERLEKYKGDEARYEAHKKAVDKLIDSNKFEIPESRIYQYAKNVINQQHQGHDHESVEPTEEEIEQSRENAERDIKKYRIIDYISKQEKIKVNQSDVDARIKEMADMYGMDFEQMKASLRSSGHVVNIREELKYEKTLNWIVGIRDEEE
ncbi:MAG: trigger factor [Fibrobacterales bacterium]